MNRLIMAVGLAVAAAAGTAQAAEELCRQNSYTKEEALAGRTAFNSHCAFCHQYSMVGREPGNTANEVPKLDVFSAGDLQFYDNAGGVVPPLIGPVFMGRMRGKSFAQFSSMVGGAALSFPPAGKVETPYTYLQLAAYVLYRNCGKL